LFPRAKERGVLFLSKREVGEKKVNKFSGKGKVRPQRGGKKQITFSVERRGSVVQHKKKSKPPGAKGGAVIGGNRKRGGQSTKSYAAEKEEERRRKKGKREKV